MKVLELFSGTECISNAFRARGHECYTVDWDEKFPSTLHIDILQLTAEKILSEFGKPDIIWSGNDCTTFSVAAISGAKLGWTTEAGTEDDNENGGDAGDDNTNTGNQGGNNNNPPSGELEG